jgi:hypothetical protein
MKDRPRCVHCGEIIGVYEPARLVFSDGITLRGPPSTRGAEPVVPGSLLLHEACYQPFARERPEGRADTGG